LRQRVSIASDRLPRRGELWAADLNPRAGTEAGKVRPVVIVQSDLLNTTGHPSTWIVPCTTHLTGTSVLRVELPAGVAGNRRDCEVMIDQSRAVDRSRLRRPLGAVPPPLMGEISEKLRLVGDL
jgi:mRNA interferase MazF